MTDARLGTRLAIGIEIPLAHTIVDRLLGFDRSFGESRLQLSPAEWGVWTFLFLRAAARIRSTPEDGALDSPEKSCKQPLVVCARGSRPSTA